MKTKIRPLHDRVSARRPENESKTAGGIVIPNPLQFFVAAVLTTVLLLGGCAAQNTDGAHRRSLHDLNDAFNRAAADYDMQAFLSLYAPDVLWIAQSEPPTAGHAEPIKTFQFLMRNKGRLSHTIDHLFVSADGGMAVMIGRADVVVAEAGMDAEGTYLFVLRRSGGGWKIVADMWHQHNSLASE